MASLAKEFVLPPKPQESNNSSTGKSTVQKGNNSSPGKSTVGNTSVLGAGGRHSAGKSVVVVDSKGNASRPGTLTRQASKADMEADEKMQLRLAQIRAQSGIVPVSAATVVNANKAGSNLVALNPEQCNKLAQKSSGQKLSKNVGQFFGPGVKTTPAMQAILGLSLNTELPGVLQAVSFAAVSLASPQLQDKAPALTQLRVLPFKWAEERGDLPTLLRAAANPFYYRAGFAADVATADSTLTVAEANMWMANEASKYGLGRYHSTMDHETLRNTAFVQGWAMALNMMLATPVLPNGQQQPPEKSEN